MNKIIVVALNLFIVALLFANAYPGSLNPDRPLYASDRIKLKLTSEAILRSHTPQFAYESAASFSNPELDAIFRLCGGEAVIRAHISAKDKVWEKQSGFDRWFVIRLNGQSTVEEALALFRKSPWVEEAAPEYFAYLMAIPNDSYYPDNWGHNNTAQLPGYQGGSHSGAGVGTIGFDSDAQLAWDQSQGYGDPNVIIAILDTGADLTHPDLRLVPGYDYGDNDNDPTDNSSEQGHGTCCSGIAAGKANNSIGVAGVAGGCSVMPLKIATASGDIPFTAIENALIHAGDNNVHVASMSFGANTNVGSSPATDAALVYAKDHGVTLFASTANNNGSSIYYPAKHPSVISVGAASPTGQRKNPSSSDGENWWGSNYGVNTQDSPNAVDVMAPTILPATDISGNQGYSNGQYFMWFNGTSCSSPYAAGVAALIKSKDISLTPDQVRNVMTQSATDMTFDGGAGWDRYTGYGLVNANAALLLVNPTLPYCSITYPPSNSVLNLGENIEVTVAATDPGRNITTVQFYLDNSLNPEYTDNSAPYSWAWNTLASGLGQHSIKAVVTDNDNNTGEAESTVFLVLPADEGFESGDFSAYLWYGSGAAWMADSTQAFTGDSSAHSGWISINESSELSLRLNITTAGEVSFYKKVSSALDHGKLRFMLDGLQLGEWSGEVDWSPFSYAVSPGVRTFSWIYEKDDGPVAGNDCAWLDQIIFPQFGVYFWEPQAVQATGGNDLVLIRWQAPPVSAPQHYKIIRNGSLLFTTTDLLYTDTMVDNGTTYTYNIIAVYENGESEAGAGISVTPQPVTVSEVEIGSGIEVSQGTQASPVNVYFRSLHGQSIYLASELNAMGVYGPINLTSLGFYVESAPQIPLVRFYLRLKNISATDVANWQAGDSLQTVYYNVSYMPQSGNYQMIQFDRPFYWNGLDNLLVDSAFGTLSASAASGVVRYSSVANGYRYTRNNTFSQTNVFLGGTVESYRPNIKLGLELIPTEPEIEVLANNLTFGNLLPGFSSYRSLTVSNTGAGILSGEISTPNGFTVEEAVTDGARNVLSFSLPADSTLVYNLIFTPASPGEYSGNVLISHNAASESISLAVNGQCTEAKAVPFVEGLEEGQDNWEFIDANQTNRWAWGPATSQSGGHAFYVSQDGGASNTYNLSARSKSHLLRYVNIPASDSSYTLRFAWKAKGEGSGPYNDYMRVYLIPAGSSPTAGEQLLTGQLGGSFNQHNTWQEAALNIPVEYNGQIKGLVFSWVNDGILGEQPPAAIDNIRIIADSQTDYVLVYSDSLYCSLPAVSIPEAASVTPAISIKGISGVQNYLTAVTGYNSLSTPYPEMGMDIHLSGAMFNGAKLVLYHNLGYKPMLMGYKIGSEGDWLIIAAGLNWTSTTAYFDVPDSYDNANELFFCFADPPAVLPPYLFPFTADLNPQNKVQLAWEKWYWFQYEIPGIAGFKLLRATENNHATASQTGDFMPWLEETETYTFTDTTTVELTNYYYWLEAVNEDGAPSIFGPISIRTLKDPEIPKPQVSLLIETLARAVTGLFNPNTEIHYGLAEPGEVAFEILNLKGQLVRTYKASHAAAGYFKFNFDGRDMNGRALASGVYFTRMKIGNKHWQKKMTLMK